ncbi:MAG: 1-acyl-sn-glycerol-3-phosphate acyltransferase [bacterium]
MLRWLSRKILRLFGWNTNGALPEGIEKAVVVSAPHTSYLDFVIGRLTFWAIKVNIRFLIKKDVFFFPLGWFLTRLGGLPVDRGKYKSNMVSQVVKMFEENTSLMVVITPEGTRRRVDQWKKGFYLIALEAKVPLALSFIDYGKKTGGIGPVFHPSGDYRKDLVFIQDFYKDKIARYPDRFNLSKHHRP